MPFCTKCGNQLNDNVKFCTKCGASVNEQTETEPSAAAVSAQSAQPVQTQYQPQYQYQQPAIHQTYVTAAQQTGEQPLTIGKWIGYLFLSTFLGLIGQIIILCVEKNKTIKNWVFAGWIVSAIWILLMIIFMMTFLIPVLIPLLESM